MLELQRLALDWYIGRGSLSGYVAEPHGLVIERTWRMWCVERHGRFDLGGELLTYKCSRLYSRRSSRANLPGGEMLSGLPCQGVVGT